MKERISLFRVGDRVTPNLILMPFLEKHQRLDADKEYLVVNVRNHVGYDGSQIVALEGVVAEYHCDYLVHAAMKTTLEPIILEFNTP